MIAAIANTFSNCFKIPELKSRILFTLVVLAICRLEAVVRIPGLNGSALAQFFESHAATGASVLGMYSLFTGGALEHCAVGALGIMPYISGTIIIQLLTAVIPTLSKLAREEGGRTKLIQYGRYLTVLLCLGEQITERGIGNGVSLVITIGILARLPAAGQGLVDMFRGGAGESKFNL